MATIAEIAAKSQKYVDNLQTNIMRVVYIKQKDILDLNRSQMLSSFGNDQKPLINIRTGSEYLSKAYAKRTNKRKPNIFVNGNYQNEMYLDVNRPGEYYIASRSRLVKYIPVQYPNVHGIAPINQPKAQEITGRALSEDYFKTVFQ